MWLYLLLLGLLQLALVSARPPVKLGDVFDVLMKGPGSCEKYYDSEAAPKKSDKALNKYWDQIYDYTSTAVISLDDDKYKKDIATRNLVESVFGIQPGRKQGEEVPPPTSGIHKEAWAQLKKWHVDMQNYITTPQEKSSRPILDCDGTYMELQTEKSPFIHPNGEVEKEATLKQVVDAHQKALAFPWNKGTYWMSPTDKRFHGIRVAAPGKLNGRPSLCKLDFDRYGSTISPGFQGQQGLSGDQKRIAESFTLKTPIVQLCPESFHSLDPYNEGKDEVDLKEKTEGFSLYGMGTNSITFYHELFHLVFGLPQTPDTKIVRAKKGNSKGFSKDFPRKKDSFEFGTHDASGPVQCMYLGLFDKAEPQWDHIGKWNSIRTPDCLAWFGLANYLQVHGGVPDKGGKQVKQDWSRSLRREGPVPFVSVFGEGIKDPVSDGMVPLEDSDDEGSQRSQSRRMVYPRRHQMA